MNKGRLIILLSTVLVVGSTFLPNAIVKMVPEANITKLKQVDYVGFVSATGEIQQKNKKQILCDYPIIASEILVKVGEAVTEGQPILSVNKEETAIKLMEAKAIAQATGIATGQFASSYEDAISKLPDQITSTYNGTIESIIVKQGDYVESGAPVATIIGEGDLIALIQVSENKISEIKVGQLVEITGSGFKDKKYYGHIDSINTTAKKVYLGTNQETVIDVTVSINGVDDKLKAGYTTKVRIITDSIQTLNVIPYEAIVQDNNGTEFVYVLSNGLAIRKDIETGLELSEGVQVISGVTSEDAVVSTPKSIKESGSIVKAVFD